MRSSAVVRGKRVSLIRYARECLIR